jgi:hypothetical protein
MNAWRAGIGRHVVSPAVIRATEMPLYHPVVAARIFSLSVHADYACRHSGACCTAGWSIPVQPAIRHLLPVEVLHPSSDGACTEYDGAAGLCRVHREHGEAMLPEPCYHFPRRALTDQRGTFVTLTHFCPTAAWQLFRDDVSLAIVENPPAFPGWRDYDPLDGRGEWAPLLRPTVLFDFESYSRWERYLVDTLAIAQSATAALQQIAETAERLRGWSPAAGSIAAHVEATLAEPRERASAATWARYRSFAAPVAFASILETVPHGLRRPDVPVDVDATLASSVEPEWIRYSTPVRRYLAAKAFGSWSAYHGRGVRTLVAELVASEMVVRVEAARACGADGGRLDEPRLHEAIRQADRLLMHLVDRAQLMRWFDRAEAR